MSDVIRLIKYARFMIANGYSSKTCGNTQCYYYTRCKGNTRLWCAVNVSQDCLGLGWEQNQEAVCLIAKHIKTDEVLHKDILLILDNAIGDKIVKNDQQ